MNTHTQLLLPSQFTPDQWNTLCVRVCFLELNKVCFKPFDYGFLVVSITKNEKGPTAIILHAALMPDTPQETVTAELAELQKIHAALIDSL